jgi:anaerobic magnesium-protoporphyrin IX monomethyl ester cyclase
VVLGGVHPTVLPEEVLAEKAVDIVVRGEGEKTILDIAAGMPLTDIKGISYRDQKTVIHNPDQELIADLDTIPLPAYHLLPMDKYRPAAGAAKQLPATSVLATRGCPGRCTFCYRIFGPRLRFRSGSLVAEEVKLLQDRYGFKEICFYDDTFTALKKEVYSFCRSLSELGMSLTWSCFSRIDHFNKDLFQTMKNSGCHQIMYGVETLSSEILNNINKRLNPERVRKVIRYTQSIGIQVRAAFMLGNPGETEQTLKETICDAIRLDPDLAIFNITTPYPGTEMYAWADMNNYLRTKNWDDYDLSTPVMELPTVSSQVVRSYYQNAHKRFYFRPSYIFRRIAKLRSWNDWRMSVRGVRTIIGI